MLITGVVPDILLGVVTKLLSTDLHKLLAEDDGSILAGIVNMNQCGMFQGMDKKRQGWDIIRKVPMPINGNAIVKTCMRCGSVTMHMSPAEEQMWVQRVAKYCICGNQWMIL